MPKPRLIEPEICYVQILYNNKRLGLVKAGKRVLGKKYSLRRLEVFIYPREEGDFAICDSRTGVQLAIRPTEYEARTYVLEKLEKEPGLMNMLAEEPDVMTLPAIF